MTWRQIFDMANKRHEKKSTWFHTEGKASPGKQNSGMEYRVSYFRNFLLEFQNWIRHLNFTVTIVTYHW